VSSPRAAAAGGAWVHAPPQRKSKRIGGSGTVSSPIPFPVGGEDHRHLQQEKNTQTTVDFKFFFFLSRSVLGSGLLFPFSSSDISDS
jgi:hypothetical protein